MIDLENLDDKSSLEIFNEFKQKIKYLNSEWSYVENSDPGITLLELFSWLKKEQHAYLNKISTVSKIKLLKLLGVAPKKRKGSNTLLQVSNAKIDLNIPKGTKWTSINSMIFENDSELFATRADILNVEIKNPEMNTVKQYFEFSDNSQFFYLFGKNNIKKNETREFIINLLDDIPFKKKLNIYFDIFSKYKRNEIIDDTFIQMGEIKWEYWGISNNDSNPHWEELNFTDNTNQFLFSGIVTVFHKGKMKKRDNGFYSIKISLISSNYDFMPQIRNIKLNVFEVSQKDTQCESNFIKKSKVYIKDNNIFFKSKTHLSIYGDHLLYFKEDNSWKQLNDFNSKIDLENGICEISVPKFDISNFRSSDDIFLLVSYSDDIKDKIIIGNSNKFSNLSFETNFRKMSVYDDFKIMVGRQVDNDYLFDIWERKDDFFGSSKFDNHFVYEEHVKLIAFGNNYHGAIPPYGKNNIRFCSLSFTNCEESNIKKGTIKDVQSENSYLKCASITQITSATGGQNDEPLEETYARLSQSFNSSLCAVTEDDYISIIKRAPGLIIKDVSVFFENNKLQIAVQIPETYLLPKSCKKNLILWIEKFRLLNTDIQITGLNIISLNIEVIASINAEGNNPEKKIKSKINLFFDKLNQKMGQNLIYTKLLKEIESLKYVKRVSKLELKSTNSSIVTSINNDIIVPPNGIYDIKNLEISCIISIEDI